MIRVEVKNFQSIAEETVEIAGFSVVVGRSNIGKSALVRAVKAALTGAPADNYVRHAVDCQRVVKGAKTCKCFCSVRIVGADFDLLWEKGDTVNRYVHNGTEHTVVGRGTPEFLGPEFAPIHIGGDSTATLLQVADQFRPLFILDRSGTAVADVLSDVAKLDQINDAARAAEKDKRESSATRKVRDKDLKELDRTLELYDGLDAVLARVGEVEVLGASVAGLEARAETLSRLVGSLEQVTGALRALQPIAQVEIPEVAALVEQAAQLRALCRWLELVRTKTAATRALEKVADLQVPEMADAKRLSEAACRLGRWALQLSGIKTLFARFKAAEAAIVPDLSALAALHERHRALVMWASRLRVSEASLAKSQRDLTAAEGDEAAVLAEFKELEVCPMCRQPLEALAHTHLGTA